MGKGYQALNELGPRKNDSSLIEAHNRLMTCLDWVPACAGMTTQGLQVRMQDPTPFPCLNAVFSLSRNNFAYRNPPMLPFPVS